MLRAHKLIVEFLRKNRFQRTPLGLMPCLGDNACRWCGGEVKRPRRSWCSEACVDEFRVIFWPSHAALMVEKRDKGVCAVCGIDTNEILKLRRTCFICGSESLAHIEDAWKTQIQHHWWARVVKERKADWGPWARNQHRLWEMDHTVPVIEGGGSCGLDNLRTLCCVCHAEETKRLAGRRSKNANQLKLDV